VNIKRIILAAMLSGSAQWVMAAPSLNEMQGCQGILDYVDVKLASAPANYPAQDVKKVRTGLKGYNEYIQREIITPGLLSFNGGDKSKAEGMQKQVSAYRASIVKGLQARHPQNRLFMDQAVAVNNCAKKAVPSGQELEDLKVAVNLMVELAKMN
jgi:hypothetical protein